MASFAPIDLGIGNVLGEWMGVGRNQRRHEKEQQEGYLGDQEMNRRWMSGESARDRAMEAMMQEMLAGLTGNEGAAGRVGDRYSGDRDTFAQYGQAALGAAPAFGSQGYWDMFGTDPYTAWEPESVVPEKPSR